MVLLSVLLVAIPVLSAAVSKSDPICIVGAGASGIMTARQLVTKGYDKIKVFEKNAYIGGKAYNFVDPAGYLHPMGPEGGWNGYDIVIRLLNEFKIPYQNESTSLKTIFYESQTGYKIVNPTPSDPAAFQAAFQKYLWLRKQYEAYLANGYTNGKIPDDLTVPFGTFITKYGLQALLPVIYANVQSFGYGALNQLPSLYALKTLTLGKLEGVLDRTSLFTTDYQLLFKKMANSLKSVQFVQNVQITKVERTDKKAKLTYVKNGDDKSKDVGCSALILAFQPTKKQLASFDLDDSETALFSQVYVQQYASHASSLPSIVLRDALYFGVLAYDPSKTPAIYLTEPRSDMRPIAFKKFNPNSDYAVIFNWANDSAIQPIKRMTKVVQSYLSGPLSGNYNVTVDLSIKHEYSPQVSGDSIKNGFFDKLDKMQGYRKTYYVSALTSFELVEDVFRGAVDFVNKYF